MTEPQKEKKKYDDGTLSTNHLIVESAKYNTPIKKLDGSTYDAARIMCTGDFGSKEIKIAAKVLAAPFRAALAKQVKDVCDAFKIAFANDETLEITYVSKYNAGTGYWDAESIEVGKHGRSGLSNPNGNSNQSSGQTAGGSGYNNADAQAGQVINIAVAMCQVSAGKAGFTMEDVVNKATTIVDAYKAGKDAIKALLAGKDSAQPQPQKAPSEIPVDTDADGNDMGTVADPDSLPF